MNGNEIATVVKNGNAINIAGFMLIQQ